MMLHKTSVAAVVASLSLFAAQAGAVTFSAASATFEQFSDGAWTAAKAIDTFVPPANTGGSGWAIFNGGITASQTALFTLTAPLAAGAYSLTYTLTQAYGSNHTLDTFSLAYTTAAGPGLLSAQTLVNIGSASSSGGATLNSPSTGNIDATGTLPATDVYTIVATINAGAAVTGLFLNAIDNAGAGPGRQANGNFVLTEFAVNAAPVPEPAQWALMAAGLSAVALIARRRKS